MRTKSLPPVVCVGCGKFQGKSWDYGMIGPYAHCGSYECRNRAFSMIDEDRLFGLSDSEDEPLIIPFPDHLERAA